MISFNKTIDGINKCLTQDPCPDCHIVFKKSDGDVCLQKVSEVTVEQDKIIWKIFHSNSDISFTSAILYVDYIKIAEIKGREHLYHGDGLNISINLNFGSNL